MVDSRTDLLHPNPDRCSELIDRAQIVYSPRELSQECGRRSRCPARIQVMAAVGTSLQVGVLWKVTQIEGHFHCVPDVGRNESSMSND